MMPPWIEPTTWLQAMAVLSLLLLSLPLALASAYLLLLTLLSGRPTHPPSAQGDRDAPHWVSRPIEPFFDVVVPAHDEAGHIATTVTNLLSMDWPRDRFRILVLADNCSDDTALRAQAAGARVIERKNPLQRGKGHALRHAFAVSLSQGLADAVVVVDADSVVSPGLLRAFAVRLSNGISAMQACHGVLDARRTPRTRLMAIAFAAFHRVRSRGRERLALSCGLRGNGWCITREALQAVPYRAHGLAEDVEYGLRLALAGIPVRYVDEAEVLSVMHTDAVGSATQRRRWEDGRDQLLSGFLKPLLARHPRSTRRWRRDLAIDLLLPPLAMLAAAVGLLWLVCAVVLLAAPELAGIAAGTALAGLLTALALALHALRGWQLSGTGSQGLRELLRFPRHAAWKLALRARRGVTGDWIRTRRSPS